MKSDVVRIPEDKGDKIKWAITKGRTIDLSHKDYEKDLISNMWDECPECKEKNFYIIIDRGDIGTKTTIECIKCHYKKDITNYDWW